MTARDRLEAALEAYLRDQEEDAVRLLRRLIRTPSASGEEGRPDDPGTVVGVLAEETADHGTQVSIDQLTPTSANLIERLGSGRGLFVIEAHTDVVPDGDATHWFGDDPRSGTLGTVEYLGDSKVRLTCADEHLEATIRDRMDRAWQLRPERRRRVLFGRGAFDNKGSVAATALTMAALAAATRQSGVELDGTVLGAYTTDEENGLAGVTALVHWLRAEGLLDRPVGADGLLEGAFGVSLEGSYGWAPVIGHRGILQGRIRVAGRAAHASTPGLGTSATLQMARALLALEEGGAAFQEALAGPLELSLMGSPTLAIGTTVVGGGVTTVALTADGPEVRRAGINAIPDWAEATFDVRFPPAREGGYAAAAEHIVATIMDQLDASLDPASGTWSVELVRPTEHGVSLGSTIDAATAHPLVQAARDRATQVLGYRPHLETAPGGTDATVMVHAGNLATLVEWGPGGGLSHAANEFVEIDGLFEGARALSLLAIDLLGTK